MYTTEQAAKAAGITVEAAHSYVHRGLLQPATVGQARVWTERDVEVARIIKRARQARVNLFVIGPVTEKLNILDSADDVREHAARIRWIKWAIGARYPRWDSAEPGPLFDLEQLGADGVIEEVVTLVPEEGEQQ